MMSRKRAGDIITGIRRHELGWEDLNGKAYQDGQMSPISEQILLYKTNDGVTNFKIIFDKKKQRRDFVALTADEKIRMTRRLFKMICETEEIEFVKGKTYDIKELGLRVTVRRAKYGPRVEKAA